MLYIILSSSLALLAVIIVIFALKILLGRRWFLAWMRGNVSIFAIIFSLVLITFAWDFISYKQLELDEVVATVSVKKIAEQEFQLDISLPDGGGSSYTVKGDLWQLDARILTWSGLFDSIGLKPGYRLDRLSGRYISLEQERSLDRTVYSIDNSQSVTDIWTIVNENSWVPGISARYGSATYLPMKNGALYAVALNQQGLIARALNGPAEMAIESWK